MSDDSKQWSKLLQAIAKGVVIPIVGRDLLRIQVRGREQLLHDNLAHELSTRLEVDCGPPPASTRSWQLSNARRQKSRDDVKLKTREILKDLLRRWGHLSRGRRANRLRSSHCGSSSPRRRIHSSRTPSVHRRITFSATRQTPAQSIFRAIMPVAASRRFYLFARISDPR